jgi:hypothetical protein
VEGIKKGRFSLRCGSAQKVPGHADTNYVNVYSPADFNGHSTQRDWNSQASCDDML